MTKKDFKNECSYHVYGKGKNKKNAIFFDWKSGMSTIPTENGVYYNFCGYKFMVSSNVQRFSKKELSDIMYLWISQEMYIPECPYRFADTNEKRFKVPLSM